MNEELDIWTKLKTWNHYVVTQLTLKYDFEIYNNFQRKRLHADLKFKSFEEFCVDLGDIREPSYLYGWYWRFKDKI